MQDVIVEQMLVGMLFLAPLAATLPTTWILQCVTALIHMVVAMARVCACVLALLLDSGCVSRLLQWAAQPLRGGASVGAAPDIKFLGTLNTSAKLSFPQAFRVARDEERNEVMVCGNCERRQPHAAHTATSGNKSSGYKCPVSYYHVESGSSTVLDSLCTGYRSVLTELSWICPMCVIKPWWVDRVT